MAVPTTRVPSPVAYVATLAAGGSGGGSGDSVGDGLASSFRNPNGGFVGPSGDVWVADTGNHRLKRFRPDQRVVRLAGRVGSGDIDGPSYVAAFNSPLGICADAAGIVYVADSGNHRVRRIDARGVVTTLAGSGVAGGADGVGVSAQFDQPNDVAVAPDGMVFVTEFAGNRIRRIAPDGTVTTWAGNGVAGYRDGPRAEALLSRPGGLALDAEGRLYFTEWGSHRIRRIDTQGVVSTIAGMGESGYVDGPAAEARFHNPDGIAVDGAGNVYVADHSNHAVRRVTPSGQVETLIGNGNAGIGLGGPASAALSYPVGIGLGANGVLFVVDSGNHRLLRLAPAGSGPAISVEPRDAAGRTGATVSLAVKAEGPGVLRYQWYKAGEPVSGATEPTLTLAGAVAADSGSYSVVVSNASGQVVSRVATVRVADRIDPVIVEQPLSGTFLPGQPVALQVVAEGTGPLSYEWFKDGQPIVPPAYRMVGNQLFFEGVNASYLSAGSYQVLVRDSLGSTRSEPAVWTLIPVPPPQLVHEVPNRWLYPGTPFRLQFEGRGTGPLRYVLSRRASAEDVWSPVTFNYVGEFVLGTANPEVAGDYRIEVFDLAGNPPASQTFRVLYLPQRLTLTREPVDVEVPLTGRIRLVSAAEGTPPVTYQWYRDHVAIAGATDPVLVLTHEPALEGASFHVVVRDASELSVFSRAAKVRTVPLGAAPVVAEQPLSLELASGASGRLSVRAISLGSEAGTESFRYQWLKHGEPIPFAQGAELVFAEAMAEDTSAYSVRISNEHGSTESEQAILRVLPVTQPFDTLLRVREVAGGSTGYFPGDVVGAPEAARFYEPNALAVSAGGEIYIGDAGNHRIKKIGRDGRVVHVAGDGQIGSVDGPAAASRFYLPQGIAVGEDGTVYVADTHNAAVRRIAPDGTVSTLVGGAGQLIAPVGIAVDRLGNVYVTEPQVHRIRRCAPDGSVTTVAGTGTAGFADGPGSVAQFHFPRGLAIDAAGNLFVADTDNRAIRRVSTDGEVTTVAGLGRRGFVDGPVASSRFEKPTGVVLDSDGNLFVADTGNRAIRRVGIDGRTTSVLGFGEGAEYVGPVALVGGPVSGGLALSKDGSLLWTSAHTIRAIGAAGSTNPYVRTVLESGPRGFWRLGESQSDAGAEALGRQAGRMEGGPFSVVSGVPRTGATNRALGFSDPGQVVRIPYADAFNAAAFTIDSWVRLDVGEGVTPLRHQILSSVDPSGPRGYFLRATTPGVWEFGLGDGTTWQTLKGPQVVPGTWTQVGVRFDGSVARIYVNGVLAASGPMVLAPNRSGELRLGAGLGWPALKGALDEVAVYDSALPLARILANHASVTHPDGLSVGVVDGAVSLAWFQGRVEAASSPTGPWVPVVATGSSLSLPSTGEPRFFRLGAE